MDENAEELKILKRPVQMKANCHFIPADLTLIVRVIELVRQPRKSSSNVWFNSRNKTIDQNLMIEAL